MPILVIVAGPNGSGKTTLVRTGALAGILDVPAVSINANDLARELAGGQPTDAQSLQAARICDARLDAEIAARRSVVVETVLSSDKFKPRVAAAQAAGYDVVLIYVSVRQAELAVERVANRFRLGGHAVPLDRIIARRRRPHAMFAWFAREADQVYVFDNSTAVPTLAAFKAGDAWTVRSLDCLPPDLAEALQEASGLP